MVWKIENRNWLGKWKLEIYFLLSIFSILLNAPKGNPPSADYLTGSTILYFLISILFSIFYQPFSAFYTILSRFLIGIPQTLKFLIIRSGTFSINHFLSISLYPTLPSPKPYTPIISHPKELDKSIQRLVKFFRFDIM